MVGPTDIYARHSVMELVGPAIADLVAAKRTKSAVFVKSIWVVSDAFRSYIFGFIDSLSYSYPELYTSCFFFK